MSSVNESTDSGEMISEVLTQDTVNGTARAGALLRLQQQAPATTSIIEYHSEGRLVIIGPAARAVPAAEQLIDQIAAIAIVDPEQNASRPQLDDRIVYLHAHVASVSGHLGDFDVQLRDKGVETLPLKSLLNKTWNQIDMVLDLGSVPVFDAQISPPGYFASRGDEQKLRGFISSIPYMVGEFEKPRYFNYDASICVHNRNQKTACTRCIDACPTLAIKSVGEQIQVDPYLCQGGGTCAAVCPSGAIQYVYPSLGETLGRIRQLLKDYRQAGGARARVLFMEQDHTDSVYQQLVQLDERCIPVAVDEIGALDLAVLLNTLAYGAQQVVVVPSEQTPQRTRDTVQQQVSMAGGFLQGLGYPDGHVTLCESVALTALAEPEAPLAEPAAYSGFDDKRTMIRMALDHLHQHGWQRPATLGLSDEAPFGEVQVDTQACTLCLACASVCPTRALLAGNETPQLRFVEDNCVQCGLCEQTCPEAAISREHRYLFDGEQRRAQRLLYEEPPFHCVSCGKPFATKALIDQMQERLSDHWMFGSDRALRRLKMCEDCRVADMWDEQGA